MLIFGTNQNNFKEFSMKNMRTTKTILSTIITICLLQGSAFALSKITTIESKVISTTTPGSKSSATYTVTGPENIEYRIEATPLEVQRIQSFIKNNPDAVVRFSGSVDEGNGTKVFRVDKWEDSAHTSKTTTTDTDQYGNTSVTEKTEINSNR